MYIFIIQKNLKNIIIEYIVSIHKKINNSKLIYYEDETIIINKIRFFKTNYRFKKNKK